MIYLIQGPTASGKTRLAIQLAKHLNTEIISADSRQFYKGMNIGSAKPSAEELAQVPHHFIDNRTLEYPMNVAEFETEARVILNQLIIQNGTAVITGGSAQFIDALLYGIDPIPVFPQIQETLNVELETHGIEFLQSKLKALDFNAYEVLDIQNSRRVVRALEVIIGTGNSILFYQQKKRIPCYPFLRFHVQWERADLYARINMRVDQMISEGLESEVTGLRNYKYQTVLNTVGYKEWEMFFNGMETKETVIEKIKQNSRNYAKRQLTWMKQYQDLIALNPYSEHSLLNQLLTFVNTSNGN
ncbi:MAG: tRNA (adenosine(37)-N6)-dimethylallyltransferase MiaA [Flavobacteriales bacterium]|jgi:tRNA dimethylallyltransferase